MRIINKIKVVVENSRRPLSVTEIALRVGVSPNHIEENMKYIQESGLMFATHEDWLQKGK